MQVTDRGIIFDEYVGASPNTNYSSFTDRDGARLLINTVTLVRMYELCKLDLERAGVWGDVVERTNKQLA